VSIPPAVKTVRFVPGWNGVVRDKAGGYLSPPIFTLFETGKILLVRALEEPAGMSWLAGRTVVFESEETMRGGIRRVLGKRIPVSAMGTFESVAVSRSLCGKPFAAMNAVSRFVAVGCLRQFSADGADEDVFGMPSVSGEEIAGKQVGHLATGAAGGGFYPEKILYMRLLVAAESASGAVEMADFLLKMQKEVSCGIRIGREVEKRHFLLHDPTGHGVDVAACGVTSDSVRFQKGCAAAHERVGDVQFVKLVRGVERLSQRVAGELRQHKAPKQCSRSPGKPFVNCNDRSVVLLNLFFP